MDGITAMSYTISTNVSCYLTRRGRQLCLSAEDISGAAQRNAAA